MAVEVWSKLKPKNNANFKIADPTDVEPTLEGSNSLEDDLKILSELISTGAGGSQIHVGPDEPENKDVLWFDTNDTSSDAALESVYAGENLVEKTYSDAIEEIKARVEEVSYALNKEIEPGGFQIRTYSGAYIDDVDSSTSNPALDSEFYPENPDPEKDIFVPLSGGTETTIYENDKYIGEANVNTIRVKRGTKYNLPTLKDGELAFCKDTGELFIGNVNTSGYSVTKIGSSGSGGTTGSSGGNLTGEYLDLKSPNGVSYRVTVSDSGVVNVLPSSLYDLKQVTPESPELTTDYSGLIINQMYGGGPVMGDIEIDPSTGQVKLGQKVGYVSHSFVELYNNSSTRKDLKLDGLSLQYKGPSGGWEVLALKGVIPWRHSFLVRGLQHFPTGPDEITRLTIDRYDMQWNINFSDKGFAIYLGAGTDTLQVTNPADIDGTGRRQEGFIDLLGVGGESVQDSVSAYMTRYWNFMNNHTAALRVDNNDPYNGNLDENSNRDSVEKLDYATCNVDIYGPRCLADGEWDSYVSKLQLNPNAPSMINISFGYDGDTSRSFNWHTLQTDEGYLYYRKQGATVWNKKESNKKIIKHHDCNSTIHSVTIYNLEPGARYEYKCGYDGHFSDIYFFDMDKYQKTETLNSGEKEHMRILWTSDQQSWTPYEYEAWKIASQFIDEHEEYDWMINTGDVSQNGTRAFEWRYYYKYAENTRYKCHEIAVGNNDLGGGADKNDSTPITYYLTHDNSHPGVNGRAPVNGCYSFNIGCCHFFCMNSNQKDAISHKNAAGAADWKNMFKDEIAWLKEDLAANQDKRWCIGFMHLSPVTCVRGKQQQLFIELFEEYRVHMVWCGHNHTYSRSLPLYGLPIDTSIAITAASAGVPFKDTSIPADVTDPTSTYTDEENGTVYVMCQATGYKLKGKEGQMNGAWWYDWKGPHPSAPSYIMVDISWDEISLVSYRIDNIVPTTNDNLLFYETPPIPVGPERYEGNPIYGGTNPDPNPVERVCIDYCDDKLHADPTYNTLFDYGRGSYKWRPWGKIDN